MSRVYCFQQKLDEARKVAMESDNRAASYHIAKYYESEENVMES